MDPLDHHRLRHRGDRVEGGPQRVATLGQVGDDGSGLVEPPLHRLGQVGQLRGPPGRGGELGGERVVHLGGGHAEPVRLGREVTADLVGVQVGLGEEGPARWRARGPSRRSRCAGTAGARQLQRLVGPVRRSLEPAVERGDVLAVRARERVVDLDVGVAAGVTLRNTFIRLSSPKATEELLCSPENSVDRVSRSSSCPSSRWNHRSVTVVLHVEGASHQMVLRSCRAS